MEKVRVMREFCAIVWAAFLVISFPFFLRADEEKADISSLRKIVSQDLAERKEGERMARSLGKEAVLDLVKLLKEGGDNSLGQAKILKILGEFREKEYFSLFCQYVKEECDVLVQKAAAAALAELKDFRATPVLLDYLKRDIGGGAVALAVLGDDSAVPDLLKLLARGTSRPADRFGRGTFLRLKEQALVAAAAVALGNRSDQVVFQAIRGLQEEGWVGIYTYNMMKKELGMEISTFFLLEKPQGVHPDREARTWWLEKRKAGETPGAKPSSENLLARIEDMLKGLADLDPEQVSETLQLFSLLGTPVFDCMVRTVQKGESVPFALGVANQMRMDGERYFKKVLQDPDAKVRAFAARVLGTMEAQDAKGILLDLLDSGEPFVVEAALEALGKLKSEDEKIYSKLPELLGSEEELLATRALDFLETTKIPPQKEIKEALRSLEENMEKPEKARIQALFCLLRENERKLFPEVINFLGSEREEIREFAVRRLRWCTGAYLGFDPAADKEERDRGIERWKNWWEGSGKAVDLGIQWEGILSRYSDFPMIEIILESNLKNLESASWEKQEKGFSKIAGYRKQAMPFLERYVHHKNNSVRFQIINLLATVGDKTSLPILFSALRDPVERIRIVAAEGIRVIRLKEEGDLYPEEKERVLELLKEAIGKESEPLVTNALSWALAGYGDTSGVDVLIENLKERAWVRDEAFSYLKEIAGRNFTDDHHRRAFRFETNGSEIDRARAIEAWKLWWSKNKKDYPVGGHKKPESQLKAGGMEK